MQLERIIEGIPFYICETPATGYQEFPDGYREYWHEDLCKEIVQSLGSLFQEAPCLRGIKEPDLEMVARIGSDQRELKRGDFIHVVQRCTYPSVLYVFGRASSGILIYNSSALTEIKGDHLGTGREFNRFEFLVPPKEALEGIIDLRNVHQISRGLPSAYKKFI